LKFQVKPGKKCGLDSNLEWLWIWRRAKLSVPTPLVPCKFEQEPALMAPVGYVPNEPPECNVTLLSPYAPAETAPFDPGNATAEMIMKIPKVIITDIGLQSEEVLQSCGVNILLEGHTRVV